MQICTLYLTDDSLMLSNEHFSFTLYAFSDFHMVIKLE